MNSTDAERVLQVLVDHAWDREVSWGEIKAWRDNFTGQIADRDVEQTHALVALSRFIYFGKRLVREMLRSLYRDHFEAPLVQRLRKKLRGTRDVKLLRGAFARELSATRFVGLGNPSESGAHLLYYFRQINHLPKDLFVDLGSAFSGLAPSRQTDTLRARDHGVGRYVFFDDLVASAQQSTTYLSQSLERIRKQLPGLDLRFMCLFATTSGLAALNVPKLFNGRATCLFELDDTFKAFDPKQRYFPESLGPEFSLSAFRQIADHYGSPLAPGHSLGYRDSQLLLGFTHNTPDNTLPIFWYEGRRVPWSPIFVRYDKVY